MHSKSTATMRHLFGLVLGLVILGTSWLPAFAQTQTPQSPQGWDVELLIDQSGSMFRDSDPCNIQPNETDSPRPVGLPLRQWAAYKFIDYLGIDPTGNDRIGITYFGESVEPRSALFNASDAVEASAAKALLRENNCPGDLGWTNVNQALEEAYDKLKGAASDSQKVVVLLTDGRPELADPWEVDDGNVQGKRSYFQEHFAWIERFNEEGIKLFIIALGENAQFEDEFLGDFEVLPVDARKYRDLWNHAAEQTGGEYFKVADSSELWTTYHAIAARLARVQLGEKIIGETGGEIVRESFQVPVGASRLVVTVDRNQATDVTLTDSNGTSIQPVRSEEFYDIYSVENPVPGRWSLEFAGESTAYTVLIDYKIAGINAESVDLPGVHPAGKPLPIRARVADDAGSPIDEALVGATITGPADYSTVVSLAAVENAPGVYAGTWTDTQRLGDFSVVIEASQGETKRDVTLPEVVTLDSLLYLDVLKPGAGEYLQQAEAQIVLRRGNQPVAVSSSGATPPRLDVTLQDSNGQPVASLPLSGLELQDDTTYLARFEDVPEGDYIFDVVLNVEAEGVEDREAVAFHLQPKPMPVPTPTPQATYTPVPEEPICPTKDLGTILLRPGETAQAVIVLDTTQLVKPVVVEAILEAADAPLALETSQFSLDKGQAGATVPLSLKASADMEARPGASTYPGTIALNVQGRSTFCVLSFTADIRGQRLWVPDLNMDGKAGDTWRMKVEYDTRGQQAPEKVTVALSGLPADRIRIDPDSAQVTLEPEKRGSLIIPLLVADEAATKGEEIYKGRVLFTHEDGTQDQSEIALTVVAPSALDRLLPFIILLLLIVAAIVIFFILDPLCWRCKLSGKLVYQNVKSSDIVLAGRQQKVTLQGSPKADLSPADSAHLVIRARKKGAPVVEVKDATDLQIGGVRYDKGHKGIVLTPNAIVEVGDAQIQYEHEGGFAMDDGLTSMGIEPSYPLSNPWSAGYGTDDYSSGSGGESRQDYDLPASDSKPGSSGGDAYGDLDYQ